jgi:hypothetical protein
MSSINLFDIQSAFQSIAVTDGGGSLTVDGTVAATQSGTWDIGTVTTVTAVTAITNDVSIDDGGNSITVDATNLDIRDLTSASDSVEIKTAAGQALAIDGSGFITANINGTVTVSATNLDIRDLTHASDSIKIGDGTDFLAVNTDGSINVNAAEAGYSTWAVTTETVTSTESELMSTPLANRLSLLLQNLGSQDVFLKEATGVSTSNGLKLVKGGYFEANLDAGANIFAITASGSSDLRCVQYSA